MPIILVAVVMAVSGGLRPLGADWGLPRAWVVAIALVPVILTVLTCWVSVWWCGRRISAGRGLPAVLAADRVLRFSRWLLVINHIIAVVVFDWLGVVRSVIGNPVLADELIAVLPPLLGWIGTFWAAYPLDQRLHGATFIRHLDEGEPMYPTLTRMAFVWQQTRLHLLLLLVPTLLIVGLSESLQDLTASRLHGSAGELIGQAGSIGVAAIVFVLAPWLSQWLLDVRPLAAGPLREALLDVCRRHRVRIADLMLWNTNGTMINAAVMGLVGRIRYVLITDQLLEMLRHEQVLAVMAHEIGHVRRKHLPWLVVCLMASFSIAAWVVELAWRALEPRGGFEAWESGEWIRTGATGLAVILGLLMFGWVCRRFERQADTFAVQHLSGMGEQADPGQPEARQADWVRMEAVDAMRGALHAIARLNTIELRRPSWRHGSIAWRVAYLRSIVGRPLADLPIDRLVRRLKAAAAIIVAASISLEVMHSLSQEAEPVAETTSAISPTSAGDVPFAALQAGHSGMWQGWSER